MYPQEVTWTIAADGKNLGKVTARTPAAYHLYDEAGIEEITSKGPVPTVGKRSIQYADWFGEPLYRPLVAVSPASLKAPEAWKPSHLSQGQIEAVRKDFRGRFPHVMNCKNPIEDEQKPWKYKDEAIKIISPYLSPTGWSLVEAGLTRYACDGPLDDAGPFVGQWYVVEPSGKLRLIGAGMAFIDAGDYGSDGNAEVLFAVSGQNLAGYRLFYQDLNRSAEFLYSYH